MKHQRPSPRNSSQDLIILKTDEHFQKDSSTFRRGISHRRHLARCMISLTGFVLVFIEGIQEPTWVNPER